VNPNEEEKRESGEEGKREREGEGEGEEETHSDLFSPSGVEQVLRFQLLVEGLKGLGSHVLMKTRNEKREKRETSQLRRKRN